MKFATFSRAAGSLFLAAAISWAGEMSVSKVALYKHGVAYFEREGSAAQDSPAVLRFQAAEMDDVLKSLTLVQHGGDGVASVRYDSADPLEKRLEQFSFHVAGRASFAEILDELRGAEVEIQLGGETLRGLIVSARREQASESGAPAEELVVAVADGPLRVLDPRKTQGVRLLEDRLDRRFREYLLEVARSRDREKRSLTIESSGGDSRLFAAYIAPAPIWKSSYRLVLNGDDEPRLEGWAIVDNASGEDWTNIRLSLVSGLPVSFVNPLYAPVRRTRPIVETPQDRVAEPVTYAGPVAQRGNGSIRGRITDSSGAAIPGARVMARSAATGYAFQGWSGVNGQYVVGGLPAGRYDVEGSSDGFKIERRTGVTVGRSAVNLDFALELGSVTEVVEVRGAAPMLQTDSSAVSSGSSIDESFEGADLGELFEYRMQRAVTIGAGESAILPFFQGDVEGDRLVVFDESEGSQHPRNAFELRNETGQTFDGGAVTVFEGGGYAGEALIDTLGSGDERLLSYSVDLGTRITSKLQSRAIRSNEVRASRGVLLEKTTDRAIKTYTIRNVDDREKRLWIQHEAEFEFDLIEPQPIERTADGYRFEIVVEPNSESSLAVIEEHVYDERVQISYLDDEETQVLMRDKTISESGVQLLSRIVELGRRLETLEAEEDRETERKGSLESEQSRLRQMIGTLNSVSGQQARVQEMAARLFAINAEVEQATNRIQELSRGYDELDEERERMIEVAEF